MNGVKIETGDFRELARDLADGSVDLVLTDPPYPREYLPLWGDLGAVAARVLKPSGYLVAYSGHMWLDEVMAHLSQHLTWYILMANMEPGAQSRINARAIFQEFKPVLVYQRPPVKRCNKWGGNTVTSPAASKQYHEWGQSVEPVRELVERFSQPGDLVLDPFLGGGTTAIACQETGRRCIGYELDAGKAQRGRLCSLGWGMGVGW